MAIQVRAGGQWRTLTGIKVRAGNAWRTVVAVKIFSGGAWRTVFGGSSGGGTVLSLSISPSPVNTINSTSELVTATPTGGRAPYGYAWSVSSDDGGIRIAADASDVAATRFRASGAGFVLSGTTVTGTATCVVTDALGDTASANVNLSFTRS